MKRFLVVLATMLVVVCAGDISAQSLQNAEKRHINMKLLEMIDRLETLSCMDGQEDSRAFLRMFSDRNAPVYNDVIGYSDGEYVTVTEYARLLGSMKSVKVRFSNVEKSEPYFSDGYVRVDVSFDKFLSFVDSRSVAYSTETAYGSDLRIKVRFTYDDFEDILYISSIDGYVDPEIAVGRDHVVLRNADSDFMKKILYRKSGAEPDGRYYAAEDCRPLVVSESSEAVFPGSIIDEDLYYMQDTPSGWDPDMFISVKKYSDGYARFQTKKKHFRARVYDRVSLAGAYQVSGDLDKRVTIADEAGFDLRYLMDFGTRINVGIYGGLAVSYSHVDLAVKNFGYTYECKVGTPYDRTYRFDILGQKYAFVDAVLNGGIAFEYALSRRWTLGADLGGKIYHNLSAVAKDVYCDYEVNLSNGAYVRQKGFFAVENINYEKDGISVEMFPVSAALAVNAGYDLSKSVKLTFGLGYERGLNFYYETKTPMVSYRSYKTPVRLSAASKTDAAIYGLSNCFLLKKQSLSLDLGLVFKF